ncbi:hypothetical protein ACFWY9_30460 [Amycolatopsis sp. NPDC059027]|uniref:hypothetical protein n=1 Tax=unclassified Amycolatopsis TaxID=2618356 RepID=UPI0036722115
MHAEGGDLTVPCSRHIPIDVAIAGYGHEVPAIDKAWRTLRGIAERAGVPAGAGPLDAAAVASALVWMTERVFYQATVTGSALDEAAATLYHGWQATFGIPPDKPARIT